MVDFHGWSMPINYGSQITEHNEVRESCGIFDVSHMTILDFHGEDSELFIRKLIANDVKKLKQDFEGLYSACLLYTSPSPRDMRRARMPSSA